jgi:hypothetical protein
MYPADEQKLRPEKSVKKTNKTVSRMFRQFPPE